MEKYCLDHNFDHLSTIADDPNIHSYYLNLSWSVLHVASLCLFRFIKCILFVLRISLLQ